jgi:uncharacterized protein DUF2014/helix-loop-helix DNA-binding protein
MPSGSKDVADDRIQSWVPSTGPPFESQLSDGISRGQWEHFMSWDNSQAEGSYHPDLSTSGIDGHIPAFVSPEGPASTIAGTISLQMPTSSRPTSLEVSSASGMPLTFGQNGIISPQFEFTPNELSGQLSPFANKTFFSHEASPSTQERQSPSNLKSPLSPSSEDSRRQSDNRKKRKASLYDDDSSDKLQEGAKKTSHNMIEKRYRTNLNDKIAALRDCVPALRIMSKSNDPNDDNEDLEGLAPAHKLNKATVLSKATEYIKHLQKQKNQMEAEIAELRIRVENYEKMVRSGAYIFHTPVSTPDGIRFQEDMFPQTPNDAPVSHPPQGIIPIPESIANLRQSQMGQTPYRTTMFSAYPSADSMRANSTQRRPLVNGPSRHGSMMGRVMLGGLTTLMLAEGFVYHNQKEPEEKKLHRRSLFSDPLAMASPSSPSSSISTLAHLPLLDLLSILRILLILASLLYLLLPLLSFKSKPTQHAEQLELKAVESVASPIELRQRAWLTAVQTVWVPRHSFILEIAALWLKTLKLSTRKLIGWKGYAMLTGTTKEQESARVKAWTIALDAQLTGGDAEISMSRLVLTLLASGTLPSTPSRLMLNALHVRILMWEASKRGRGSWLMLNEISLKLARSYWNAARTEYRIRLHDKDHTPDEDYSLPDHLVALLEQSADEVLNEAIIQRAYNLAWNLPTARGVAEDDAMDSIIEDVHIASPLDAVAAWWSTLVVNRVLVQCIDAHEACDSDELNSNLQKALRTAPPPSQANVRALVARAVLISNDRVANIATVLATLPRQVSKLNPSGSNTPMPTTNKINFIDEGPIPADIPIALTFAKCLALSESSTFQDRLFAASFLNRFSTQSLSNTSYSLLSFTASLLVLEHFSADPTLLHDAHGGLERLASGLRLWIGRDAGHHTGLLGEVRARVVQRCLTAGKAVMGVVESDDEDEKSDAGYVSQEDIDKGRSTMEVGKVTKGMKT